MVEYRKICHIDLQVDFDMKEPFKILSSLPQTNIKAAELLKVDKQIADLKKQIQDEFKKPKYP